MGGTGDYSFIIKVKFEEETRNLVGFFMVLGSAKEQVIMKCDVVVNYYTERFANKINLITPWASFLERIAEQNELIAELMLKDFADSIRARFESFGPDRVGKLAEIVCEVSDMNLKRVMMNDFLMEDLMFVFPKGEPSVDFVTEIIGVDEEGEEEPDAEGEEGEEGEDEETGPVEGDGVTTIAVEPVVDPVDGLPANKLSLHDVVTVTIDRQDRVQATVLSAFPTQKGADRWVVKVAIDDDTWGQMVVSKNTMIRVERGPEEEKKPTDMIFYIVLGVVVIIVIIFLIMLVASI